MTQKTNSLRKAGSFSLLCAILCLAAQMLLLTSCSELETPKTEPFYAQTAPPERKEFRWSNGKLPRSFDPAQAVAAPETDVVRAIFEGLTDTNAKTLEPIPGVAEKWTASNDNKTWTFNLRKDARWSNDEPVTAHDFVRSWTRLAKMGETLTHHKLLDNIAGVSEIRPPAAVPENETETDLLKTIERQPLPIDNGNTNTAPKTETADPQKSEKPVLFAGKDEKPKTSEKPAAKDGFGVEAVNETTLRVRLVKADKDFPALVAHPIFRPVYGDGNDFEDGKLNPAIISNGAFRVLSAGPEGVTIVRSDSFWAKERVELERVRFVPKENAEKALEAYRTGEIDAVTNVDFEPLVLKLLAPYDDFKRKTHSALNFYEFNQRRKPYNDRRVREALAIAIDRDRLTEVEMDGSTSPALNFLPFADEKDKKLVQDKDRAKELLAEAGYENGEDFPVIKLVINRNDVQQRIAKAVVKMWKQNLDVDAVIVVKESSEIEAVRQSGEFDILRRGVVLPTNDETVGMMTIFPVPTESADPAAPPADIAGSESPLTPPTETNPAPSESGIAEKQPATDGDLLEFAEQAPILNKHDAFQNLPAIPLYFPTSYSLVKPYVQGFEINTLDAPSLKDVKIDNNWQPKKPNGES